MPIRLAISTCPNDTFAFHAILQNKIDRRGLDFDIQLLDIQQLNDGLFAGEFDFAKASFHAAAILAGSTIVMPSGSAIGYGVGPLLLAAKPQAEPNQSFGERPSVTLCPGQHTTASMLFQMFYADAVAAGRTQVDHVVFSDIMPALQSGRADFGVCIHEGRFTWEQQGLSLVADLGQTWERQTNSPLPLGGILARREQPESTVALVQTVIRESIEYGLANREETLSTMKRYAQEFDDAVLFGHVDLYVDDRTLNLGVEGKSALAKISQLAKACGLVPPNTPDIEVW
jgi:1,4-dihydroxy-6-naphthoate synthase